MFENYYEINVSLNGKHFFATAPRSIPACRPIHAREMYKDFTERLPESEGFKISVTLVKCGSAEVTKLFKESV